MSENMDNISSEALSNDDNLFQDIPCSELSIPEKQEDDINPDSPQENPVDPPKTEEECKPNLNRAPFVAFVLNIMNILFRPHHFWKLQAQTPTKISLLFWPHLIILVSLRSLAFFIGTFLNPEVTLLSAILQGVSSFLLIFLAIFLFAFITATATKISGAKFSFYDGLRFISYSVTPLLLMGFLAVIPVPYARLVVDFIAMPYAFFVMGAGAATFLGIPAQRSSSATGLFCGILLCLWGALPTLIPMLLHFFLQTVSG